MSSLQDSSLCAILFTFSGGLTACRDSAACCMKASRRSCSQVWTPTPQARCITLQETSRRAVFASCMTTHGAPAESCSAQGENQGPRIHLISRQGLVCRISCSSTTTCCDLLIEKVTDMVSVSDKSSLPVCTGSANDAHWMVLRAQVMCVVIGPAGHTQSARPANVQRGEANGEAEAREGSHGPHQEPCS
jgi:hypothetical protein